jgi:hypothetical protein
MNAAIFDIVLFFVFCMNSIDFVDPVYLQPVNAYVAIFGVVFATSTSLADRCGVSGTDTDVSVCSLELRSFTCCESNNWGQQISSASTRYRRDAGPRWYRFGTQRQGGTISMCMTTTEIVLATSVWLALLRAVYREDLPRPFIELSAIQDTVNAHIVPTIAHG